MKRMDLPKTLGGCADRLYALRQERLAYQRETDKRVAELKEQEKVLEDHVFKTFDKQQLAGGRGRVASVSINVSQVPTVKDWPAFYEYVRKKRAWDLMQRSVTTAAFRERWDRGEEVPGTERFDRVTLSVTKI